jgi:hypothetical protein
VGNAEVGAGVPAGVGAVGGAVVGEHAFHGEAAVGVPGDGSGEDADGGGGLLVAADFGVGDAGVVVDDGVEVGGSDPGFVVLAPLTGPACCRLCVETALHPADVAPAARRRHVGDVAELGDVDVDEGAGVVVFVAA